MPREFHFPSRVEERARGLGHLTEQGSIAPVPLAATHGGGRSTIAGAWS